MPSPPTSPTMSPRPTSASSHHAQSTSQRDDNPMQVFIQSPSGHSKSTPETNDPPIADPDFATVTTLTIPPSTSIAMVKSLIAVQHPQALPSANARLTFNGRTLDSPEKTLADLEIPPSSTLEFALPSRLSPSEESSRSEPTSSDVASAAVATPTAAPTAAVPAKPATKSSGTPKRKGPRCTSAGCNLAAQRIVGECGFCGGNFCGKHRLLESHSCTGLEDAKKADKDRNKARLESERTHMNRGLV